MALACARDCRVMYRRRLPKMWWRCHPYAKIRLPVHLIERVIEWLPILVRLQAQALPEFAF
jgi:hypothetical protein